MSEPPWFPTGLTFVGFHGCSIGNRYNQIGEGMIMPDHQLTDEQLNAPIIASTTALNDLLRVMTFRPGLSMEVHRPELWCVMGVHPLPMYDNICLHYTINVPNTYHPQDMTNLHMHQSMPRFVVTVQDFYDYVLGIALWFDNHEGREWVKVNGRPWRDPHARDARGARFDPQQVFNDMVALRPGPPVQVAEWKITTTTTATTGGFRPMGRFSE